MKKLFIILPFIFAVVACKPRVPAPTPPTPSTTSWYKDADSDGYGNPSTEVVSTNKPDSTYVADNTDCNDDVSTGGAINPGAAELTDGIDNNCNSAIDEVCYATGGAAVNNIFNFNTNQVSFRGSATSITVAITSGLESGDTVSYSGADPSVTSTTWDAQRGILTLSGTFTQTSVQSIMPDIQLANSSSIANKTVSYAAATASTGPTIYLPNVSRLYQYVAASGVSYQDAKAQCGARIFHDMYGSLATVVNANQQSAMSQFFGGNTAWIGAKGVSSADGGAWAWDTVSNTQTFYIGTEITGSAIGYNNWGTNEPQSPSSAEPSYVLISASNGKWVTASGLATSADGYICSYGLSSRMLVTGSSVLGSCSNP